MEAMIINIVNKYNFIGLIMVNVGGCYSMQNFFCIFAPEIL